MHKSFVWFSRLPIVISNEFDLVRGVDDSTMNQ